MHILEIPSFFPPYGGLFCLEQARALKARGHEVRILSCTQLGFSVSKDFYIHASTKRKWMEMEGVEVYQTYMRGLPRLVRYNVSHWLKIVDDMFSDYVDRYGKPDILHAHCCKLAGVAAMNISRKYDIPYFITEHLSSELYVKDFGNGWTRHRWLKEMMRQAFENADHVIPVSKELVDDIAPFFGRNYKYQDVSNIIDTDFFTYQERAPLEGRPFRYCCLAIANIYEKGYDLLAQAWNDIDNAELHIAGSGTDGAELKALFKDYSNVSFHGHLTKPEVRDLLYKCDALVLPSRSEAQPLVILEAMATGIPVVSTECVPQSERIPGACFIAETGNTEHLHQKMLEVQSARVSVRTTRHYVRITEAIRRMCSPDAVVQQLEAIFIKGRKQ